jgi:hypothetical protein
MTSPLQSPEDVVEWIDACVLGDLRTLICGIDAYYASPKDLTADGRPTGSANFLLVAGCCSAIDYLAHIYASKGSDEAKATVFIDTFLAPINQRYGEVGLLIWKCFRQGTVHRSWPKRIVLENGTAEVITGAGSEASDPHLSPLSGLAADSLLINGRQLLSDLTRAFDDGLRHWILTDAPADALERAKPQNLRVGGGTIGLQVEAVRRWNAEDRLPSV